MPRIRERWEDRIGRSYRFDYPKEFVTLPDYSAHRGQLVTVTRVCGLEECALEFTPMFGIRASDGWEGVAFLSELVEEAS